MKAQSAITKWECLRKWSEDGICCNTKHLYPIPPYDGLIYAWLTAELDFHRLGAKENFGWAWNLLFLTGSRSCHVWQRLTVYINVKEFLCISCLNKMHLFALSWWEIGDKLKDTSIDTDYIGLQIRTHRLGLVLVLHCSTLWCKQPKAVKINSRLEFLLSLFLSCLNRTTAQSF